jgi:hypothetical protein
MEPLHSHCVKYRLCNIQEHGVYSLRTSSCYCSLTCTLTFSCLSVIATHYTGDSVKNCIILVLYLHIQCEEKMVRVVYWKDRRYSSGRSITPIRRRNKKYRTSQGTSHWTRPSQTWKKFGNKLQRFLRICEVHESHYVLKIAILKYNRIELRFD